MDSKTEILNRITKLLETYDYLTLQAVYRVIKAIAKEDEKHDKEEPDR